MVKPPDVFPNYRIRELWKGSQAGAPKWWSRQWRVCSRRVLGCTFVAGQAGAPIWRSAAMRDGVMPLQWEGKCIVQELFVALSFSFAFAFALSCSFSKTFDGSFLGALVGTFLGAFVFLPGMWSGGRSESLPLPLPL